MKEYYPAYYGEFRCLAGACPDSCCRHWEVVVDDDTFARYRSLEGPLGAALLKAMTVDEDGDRIIAMRDGRCPFWNEAHLCRVELELGHDGPCKTCREFPRILQDYGAFAEHDLSLACPEAVRLVLERDPWPQVCRGNEEALPEELDGALMQILRQSRAQALSALESDLPFARKLGEIARLTRRVQTVIDGEPPWEDAAPALPVEKLLDFYRGLEILTDTWRELLDRVIARRPTPEELAKVDGAVLEWNGPLSRWAAYFIRRYWNQAVSDRDLETRVQMLLAAWVVQRQILAVMAREKGVPEYRDLPEVIRLYSKEVEHDGENCAELADALFYEAEFSLFSLLGACG